MSGSPQLHPYDGPAKQPRARVVSPHERSRARSGGQKSRPPYWEKPDPSPGPLVRHGQRLGRPYTDDLDSGYYGSLPPQTNISRSHTAQSLPRAIPIPLAPYHGSSYPGDRHSFPYHGRNAPHHYHGAYPVPVGPPGFNLPAVGPEMHYLEDRGPFPTGNPPYDYFSPAQAAPAPFGYYGPSTGPPPGGIPPPGYYDPSSWGAANERNEFYPGGIAPPGYCGPMSRVTLPREEEVDIPATEVEHVLDDSLISEYALNQLGLKYFRWDDRSFYIDDGITKVWKDRLITLTERLRETEKLNTAVQKPSSYQAVYDTGDEPTDISISMTHELIDDLDGEVEEFSRLRRIGSFRKAHAYFDDHLRSHLNPYFIIMGAELLLDMGHYRALKNFQSLHDATFHSLKGPCDGLLAWNWQLIHLSAAIRREAFDAKFFEQFHVTAQGFESLRDSFSRKSTDSSQIRILTRLLEIMASHDFDEDHHDEDWVRLYELLEDLDWLLITERLYNSGRIWDFRDIFTNALPVFGTRTEAMFFGRPIPSLLEALSRWQSDPQDISTNLALLDMYNSIIFTFKPSWNSRQYDEICNASEKIMSVLKENPDNLSCRMYAEWSLLNVIYSAQRIRAPCQLADGLFIIPPGTSQSLDGSLLQIMPRDRDVLQMALSLAKELGDYRTQSKCLEIAVLIVGSVDRARLIAETVRLKEVVQGVAFTGIDLTEEWPVPPLEHPTSNDNESQGPRTRREVERISDSSDFRGYSERTSDLYRGIQARGVNRQHSMPIDREDRRRLAQSPPTLPSTQRRRLMARFMDSQSPMPEPWAHLRRQSGPISLGLSGDNEIAASDAGSETVREAGNRPLSKASGETIYHEVADDNSGDSEGDPTRVLYEDIELSRRRKSQPAEGKTDKALSKTPLPNQSTSRSRAAEYVRQQSQLEDNPSVLTAETLRRASAARTYIAEASRPQSLPLTRNSFPGRQRDQEYLSKLRHLHAKSVALSSGAEPVINGPKLRRTESFERVDSMNTSSRGSPGSSRRPTTESTEDPEPREVQPIARPPWHRRKDGYLEVKVNDGDREPKLKSSRGSAQTWASMMPGRQLGSHSEALLAGRDIGKDRAGEAPEAQITNRQAALGPEGAPSGSSFQDLHEVPRAIGEISAPSNAHKGKGVDRALHPAPNETPEPSPVPGHDRSAVAAHTVHSPGRIDSPGPRQETTALPVQALDAPSTTASSDQPSPENERLKDQGSDEPLDGDAAKECESPTSVVKYCPPHTGSLVDRVDLGLKAPD